MLVNNVLLFLLYKKENKMSRKQNNKLEIGIGLDTLTLDIPTEYELLENAYDFVSDRTNNIIGTLTKKQEKLVAID